MPSERAELESLPEQQTLSSTPVLSADFPEITNLVQFDSQTMAQRAFRLQLFQQGLGLDNGFAGNTGGVK